MLSNNGLCLHSCAVRVTIFSNSSIIPPGFKFMELHALTLAARSYTLLALISKQRIDVWMASLYLSFNLD